jgi:hypothetical protein
MAELTAHEAYVLGQVRKWHEHHGGPVECDLARGVGFEPKPSYGQANRALASLVSKGLLSKPRRGYYLPTEENA